MHVLPHAMAPECSLHLYSRQSQLLVISIGLAEARPPCCMRWGRRPVLGQVPAHLAAPEGGLNARGCARGVVVYCLSCWGAWLSGQGLEVLC